MFLGELDNIKEGLLVKAIKLLLPHQPGRVKVIKAVCQVDLNVLEGACGVER